MKYKVGIYDKWLNSYGGGEKVATVMAEVLSKNGYEVELISSYEADRDKLSQKMSVDLSSVKLINWLNRSYLKLKKNTKKYDLFINVSYLDHQPSAAKKSLYYVHFPTPTKKTIFGYIKYAQILPLLRKYLVIPIVNKGLEDLRTVHVREGKWLKPQNSLIIANPPNDFKMTIRIYNEPLNISSIEKVHFSSPNANVVLEDRFIDHQSNILSYKLNIKAKKGEEIILNIDTTENINKYFLAIVSMTIHDYRYFLWNLFKRYLPRFEMALYGSSIYKPEEWLDDYDLLLTNSKFTKLWVEKYWDKKSDILYPPIDTHHFSSGKKEDIILSVGRFFVGGHSKRQDVLIRAFKQLVDEVLLPDGWELHFVGGVASGLQHYEYLNRLKEESEGYPIYFHMSIPYKQLKALYAKSKIYWHAAGYGVNEKKSPIELEHFGITVVEAMSAGVVPVVYGAGGVKETVGQKEELLWSNHEDLIKITRSLIMNKDKLSRYSKEVVSLADEFSRDNFERQFLEKVELLLKNDKT